MPPRIRSPFRPQGKVGQRIYRPCCSQFAELLTQLVVIGDIHTAIMPAALSRREPHG